MSTKYGRPVWYKMWSTFSSGREWQGFGWDSESVRCILRFAWWSWFVPRAGIAPETNPGWRERVRAAAGREA